MSLLQDLRNSMPAGLIRPIGVTPVGHKVDRMAAQFKFEAGHRSHLAKDATWHAEFLSEMLAFPNGRHEGEVSLFMTLVLWQPYFMKVKPDRAIGRVGFRQEDGGGEPPSAAILVRSLTFLVGE